MSNMLPSNPSPHREQPSALAPSILVKGYARTHELWTVTYEQNGIQASGKVVGFSEAGWHISGDARVYCGTTLTLHVRLPHRPQALAIPSVMVQAVNGTQFIVRVAAQANS